MFRHDTPASQKRKSFIILHESEMRVNFVCGTRTRSTYPKTYDPHQIVNSKIGHCTVGKDCLQKVKSCMVGSESEFVANFASQSQIKIPINVAP